MFYISSTETYISSSLTTLAFKWSIRNSRPLVSQEYTLRSSITIKTVQKFFSFGRQTEFIRNIYYLRCYYYIFGKLTEKQTLLYKSTFFFVSVRAEVLARLYISLDDIWYGIIKQISTFVSVRVFYRITSTIIIQISKDPFDLGRERLISKNPIYLSKGFYQKN